jgi:hypothetical protein
VTPEGIVLIGLILAACAAPSSDGEPGASAGGEPSAPAESQEPGQSQSGGGGGGGGGGIGTTLGDGPWTGGTAQVDVSGDASASFDAPLFGATSITDGAITTLTYVSTDGGLIGIAVDTESFSVSVTTAEFVGGGGTTTSCSVTYQSTADNNISGDFSCPDSPAFTATGASGGTLDIEGSFTATR